MGKRAPRLRFSEEEQTVPELGAAIRKADRKMDRLERAEARIPKKRVKRKECAVDPKSGRVTAHLCFEETDKKRPPSKLSHAARDAPVRAAASHVHRQLREEDQDNVGLEAAHKSEEAAETAARMANTAHHSQQMKPYRAAARAENQADRANLDALYRKAARDEPQSTASAYSRWQQKRAIKKEYAAAKAGQGTAGTVQASEITTRAAQRVEQGRKQVTEFLAQHKKGFLILRRLRLLWHRHRREQLRLYRLLERGQGPERASFVPGDHQQDFLRAHHGH